MVFTDESTTGAFSLRARREGLRDFGACMSPMNAFQILQGIETLGLRMQKHIENTRKVVTFLDSHEAIESVSYPELPTHPDHELARKSFRAAAVRFSVSSLGKGRARLRRESASSSRSRYFAHLANVGDAKSLVIHPATTTHYRMDDAALRAAGITVNQLCACRSVSGILCPSPGAACAQPGPRTPRRMSEVSTPPPGRRRCSSFA